MTINHVNLIPSTLGSSAVGQPAIDVSVSPTSAFSKAAQAAGLVPAGTAFNPYPNDESVLLGAYLFEDVGVTACIGDSTLLSNQSTAIVPPRTTVQVLNIVYLNYAAVSSGGFFPNGLNGPITTSA